MDDAAKSLLTNDIFIADCARFAEGLLDEKAIRKRYKFTDAMWEKLGADDELFSAIEAERVRRIRNGAAKRERAQQLVVKAPDVLGTIMTDERASPRHRVDAIRTLDQFAGGGPEATPAGDRFHIVINLGADTRLKFNKSVKPDPHDVEIIEHDSPPGFCFPAIAANKRDEGGGSGEPI
jgi:hypothetical protein